MRIKFFSLYDLYRNLPKIPSAATGLSSDAPPAPSIRISAAPAVTGTEVATREQLVVQEPIQRAFIPKVEKASLVLFLIIDHVCSIPSAKDRFLRAQPLLLPLRKPTPILIRLRRAHS